MAAAPPPDLSQVRDVVAVHSAKGGVGKSTAAVNLAVTFARLGMKVALLDADVWGPSVAHMMGSSAPPVSTPAGDKALSLRQHGVRYLSLANVAGPDAPIIWRGPMVSGAIQQMLGIVEWGAADLLIIDMPPGTGDAVLGIGQTVTLSGVVVVTTPQSLALSDTRRGIRAFEKLQVPVLGLIENMAEFVCDGCGDRIALFGEGGGQAAAEELGIPFLGRVPMDPAVVPGGDSGVPVAASDPDGPAGRAFGSIARQVVTRLSMEGGSAGAVRIAWEKRKDGDVRTDPPEKVAESGDPHRPDAVWQAADRVLGIRWGDGATTYHGAYELRMACPCASCVEEWTGRRMPSLDAVPNDVRPVDVKSVGRYALLPVWSDGHRTGMFAFRDLREGAGAVNL